MEYTNEMYIEDVKIANYTLKHYFSNYSYMRNDLIQAMIIALWRARPKYDESQSKYSTYAITICKRTVYIYYKLSKYNKRRANAECVYTSELLTKDLTIEDILQSVDIIEQNINYECF